MHVWDAGAVPKNRYRSLVWGWLEECDAPRQLSFTGWSREKGKDPPETPASFKFIILYTFQVFINLGIFC